MRFSRVVVEGKSATASIIREEMGSAVASIVGSPMTYDGPARGEVVVGTPTNSETIRALGWENELAKAGPEGFVIRTGLVGKRSGIAIASQGETGALYGAYHFLRLLATAQSIDRLDITERPKVQLRMINHWDNMDGSIERGYAGRSLWQWNELPGTMSPRYVDYARANASVGINGTVINSVNANVLVLTPDYLVKVAALADLWRPYGLRMYLSPNFAAPIRLGGLKTADPLDPGVISWWKAKAEEIYKRIPDFGGFLVKANSEGQPGPKDYGRNHAEGANCLADAVGGHGGHVIWRAFIYDEDVDPDRAKRAYIEFTKLDGQFRPNVLVQVKNGAIDFMPREPFHPLFGALNKTPIIAEIQATQEYLGQAKHLVYLGTMWQEFLESDTYAKGKGSTVGKVIEGEVIPQRVTGLVSVLNPGLDRNWCGHHFSQSNWYASGRLAWNPELTALQIADEWTRMTFSNEAKTLETIRTMMMGSREAFVNYTMPLGLAPSNRRQPLRAHAAERQGAAGGLDGHLLPPGSRRRDRLRSDDEGEQGRRAVLPARPRHVRRPRDVPREIPAVVPPLRVGLQVEVRQDAVGRTLRALSGGRPPGRSDADDVAVTRRPDRPAAPQRSRRPARDSGRRCCEMERSDRSLLPGIQQATDSCAARVAHDHFTGRQKGSPAGISSTGTSVMKVFSHSAQIFIPGSSETAWPSTITPFGRADDTTSCA